VECLLLAQSTWLDRWQQGTQIVWNHEVCAMMCGGRRTSMTFSDSYTPKQLEPRACLRDGDVPWNKQTRGV
jgi:hypothetical protein